MPKDRQEDGSTETGEGVAHEEEPGVEEEEEVERSEEVEVEVEDHVEEEQRALRLFHLEEQANKDDSDSDSDSDYDSDFFSDDNQQQSTLNLYSHIQHPVLNVFLFAFILEIK